MEATPATVSSIPLPDVESSSSVLAPLTHNPIVSSISDVYNAFYRRREALGLSSPGQFEDISKEVTRSVFLNAQMFSGFRAEFVKAFSTAPLFQTAHNFSMGGGGSMPPYSFAALYGTNNTFFQGQLDSEFSMGARFNYRISKNLVSKTSINIQPGSSGASQSMLSLEAEYNGADSCATIKAGNASILDGDLLTGTVVGSFMQSVTPSLALGLETMWQRPSSEEGPQTATSYAARYKGIDWIASAQFLSQGVMSGSYWKRLSERVEAGVDVQLSFMGLIANAAGGMGPPELMGSLKNDGNCTIGAKYDFRTSVFRGQIDSAGKVSTLLDKQITPSVRFTFAGEMDHSKNAARIGMSVAIESPGSDEFAAVQEKAMQDQIPPKQDSPPF